MVCRSVPPVLCMHGIVSAILLAWVVLKGAAKRPHARHPGCSCHCTLLRLAGHLDDGELEPTSGRAAPKAALPAAAKGSMALAH